MHAGVRDAAANTNGVKRSRLLAGSFGLALAPSLARRAAAQPAATSVRVGVSAVDFFAQPFYAHETGIFQKAGLNADIHVFGTTPPIVAAVASGDLDIGGAVPTSVANAIIRGVPLVIIASGALDTMAAQTSQVCVAKTSSIRTAKDFEGQSIAVSGIKSLSELATDVWLTQHGADPAKVGRIEFNQPAMVAAVDRGAIAGALLGEPQLSEAHKSIGLQYLGDPFLAIAPRILMSCWYTTTAFAEKNPDVIHRFQSALHEVSRWANTHHAESAAILAKYSKIDIDLLHNMTRCAYAEELRATDFQPELDVAVKFGIVPKALNAADLFIS